MKINFFLQSQFGPIDSGEGFVHWTSLPNEDLHKLLALKTNETALDIKMGKITRTIISISSAGASLKIKIKLFSCDVSFIMSNFEGVFI